MKTKRGGQLRAGMTRALRAVRWSAIGVAVGLSACDRTAESTVGLSHRTRTQSQMTGRLRTYAFGSARFELFADSGRLVVDLDGTLGQSILVDHASAAGIPAAVIRALGPARGHRIVDFRDADAARQSGLRSLVRGDVRLPFVAPIYVNSVDGGDVIVLNRLAVRFRGGTTAAQIDSIERATGMRLLRAPNPARGWFDHDYAYPAAASRDPLAFAEQLDKHPLIAFADPDKISGVTPHSVPADPFYALQWHLKNSIPFNGVPVDVAVERVWDFTKGYMTGGGVKIAVLDDGVQAWHEDMLDRVSTGYDALGNCAACVTDPQIVAIPFYNPAAISHGTAVAGIVAASQNSAGVSGVAPEAVVVPVRIFDSDWAPASDLSLRDAINWAWAVANVDVISNSWGRSASNPSAAVDSAIANAVTYGRGGKGTPVVFSAGNSGHRWSPPIGGLDWPATNANVIAVSAIDRYGASATYAPQGANIFLVAGSGANTGACVGDVVTIDRMGAPGCNDGPSGSSNYSATFSGTSAAAPQVSGVIALLIAREPALSLGAIKTRLISGADSWGPVQDFGYGKVNAMFTVLPIAATISGPSTITSTGTYAWAANPTGGSGTYSYAWHYQNYGVAAWNYLGAGSTISRSIGSSTPTFKLRVTVSTAGRSAPFYLQVTVSAGGGCSPFC